MIAVTSAANLTADPRALSPPGARSRTLRCARSRPRLRLRLDSPAPPLRGSTFRLDDRPRAPRGAGGGKGTQAPILAAAWGSRARFGRPPARRGRGRDGARSRGRPLHEPRPARAGRHDRPGLPRPSRGGRRRQRSHPRRLPADEGPGRGPRRRAGRSRPSGGPRRATSTCPLEDLVTRMASRRICTANGHVYNLVSNPPAVESVCDIDGSDSSSAPTTRRRPSGPAWREQVPPLLEVVDHYRARGVLRVGRRRSADRHGHRRASGRRRRHPDGLTMVTRKSRTEIDQDAPGRPGRRPRSST